VGHDFRHETAAWIILDLMVSRQLASAARAQSTHPTFLNNQMVSASLVWERVK